MSPALNHPSPRNGEDNGNRGFLREYVFHNFGLKLVSLLIAGLLWLLVESAP